MIQKFTVFPIRPDVPNIILRYLICVRNSKKHVVYYVSKGACNNAKNYSFSSTGKTVNLTEIRK